MNRQKNKAFSLVEILISIFIFLLFVVFFMSFSSNYKYNIEYIENNVWVWYLLWDTSDFFSYTWNLNPWNTYLYFSGWYFLTWTEINLNKFWKIAASEDRIFKRKIISSTWSFSFTSSTAKSLTWIIYKNDVLIDTSLCQTSYCNTFKITE